LTSILPVFLPSKIPTSASTLQFIVFDYADRYHIAAEEMARYVRSGQLKLRETRTVETYALDLGALTDQVEVRLQAARVRVVVGTKQRKLVSYRVCLTSYFEPC
jgi:hypothetical protein